MLRLRGELLHELIRLRFSSVEGLLAEWEVRAEAGDFPDEPAPPDRSSLFRWVGEELPFPRHESRLLRLCGLLDADPFCLLTLPLGNERSGMERLHGAFATNAWPRGLSFLGKFFGLQMMWPPPGLSEEFFARKWCVEEFAHDAARRNYSAQIEIRGATSDLPPQIFHFAYFSLGRWAQYGLVERRTTSLHLIQINGQMNDSAPKAGDPSIVETWFGQEACKFRVASIHPFALKLRPNERPEPQAVRFIG